MGAISKILRNSDSLQGGALRSRLIIGLMVLILALKPTGLFGRE